MREKNYIFLAGLIACLALTNCASSQDKSNQMKITAFKLLNHLKEKDSLGVARLFGDKEMLYKKRKEIASDCNLVREVTNKYGFPIIDSLNIVKAKDRGNIIWVNLLSTKDSLMGLQKCDLIVYFYPDELVGNANKFISYTIFTESLHSRSLKIIEAPEIKIE